MKSKKIVIFSIIGTIAAVLIVVIASIDRKQEIVESAVVPHGESVVVQQNDGNQKRLYDETIKEVEQLNPELNPDLPSYRDDLALIVLQRMNKLKETGMAAHDALRQAVIDTKNSDSAIRERQARDERERELQSRYATADLENRKNTEFWNNVNKVSQNAGAKAACLDVAFKNVNSLNVRALLVSLCNLDLEPDRLNNCMTQFANEPSVNAKRIIVDACSGYSRHETRQITTRVETDRSVPIPSPPQPSAISSCDPAGCWDNLGGRYNKGGGNTFFRSDGKICQSLGGQMICN